jgi:23S rRNA pseudouridine2605 synthase
VKQRIQKLLAAAGVASRRSIEEMVLQGRVAVNGKVIARLPIMIDPESDRVTVDGENVRLRQGTTEQRIYLLMNKPKGVYSTNVAQGEQKRVIDLLPPGFPFRVFPVGRLEAESKGLLLLTNDGELTNKLTHPRYGVAKTYRAVVDGTPTPKSIEILQEGIWLADPHKGGFKTGRSQITIVKRGKDRSVLEIVMREQANPQIRRMLAKVGHKVRELTRTRFGPLTLHNLEAGEVRTLTSREIRELRSLEKPTPSGRERSRSQTSSGKPAARTS